MTGEINNVSMYDLLNAYVSNLERLDNLVEYLETQDVISEDNPAFKEMCEFYVELEQVATNFRSILESKVTTQSTDGVL